MNFVNDSVFAELDKINKMTDISEKYKQLRKLYCKNQDIDVVSIAYARLLSTFSDPAYLQRASKVCEKLIENNSKVAGEAKLVKYQITKKLNPNANIKSLFNILTSIDTKDDILSGRIWYEKLLLLEKVENLDKKQLEKGYKTLIKTSFEIDKSLSAIAYKRLLPILINNNNFADAREYLKYVDTTVNDKVVKEYRRVKFYIDYKLGNITNIKTDNYFENQVVNYSDKAAISHIMKHSSEEATDKDISFFKEGVSTNELFYEVKSCIENMTPTSTSSLIDTYHVQFNKIIGVIGNNETNTVEVVTEIGTKNIHTIYPIIICSNNLIQNQRELGVKYKKKIK